MESGIGSLSLSSGSVQKVPSRSLVSSSSVPLDLSSGGSIIAGLPTSPVPMSDTCKLIFISF